MKDEHDDVNATKTVQTDAPRSLTLINDLRSAAKRAAAAAASLNNNK